MNKQSRYYGRLYSTEPVPSEKMCVDVCNKCLADRENRLNYTYTDNVYLHEGIMKVRIISKRTEKSIGVLECQQCKYMLEHTVLTKEKI